MLIVELPNHFDLRERAYHCIADGQNFEAWATHHYRGREHMIGMVVMDGAVFHRERWADPIPQGAQIVIAIKPGTPLQWVQIALAVFSIASAALTPRPKSPSDAETSPAYSLGAQTNAARLGAPIPVQYGRHRIWMDLLAQPFHVYNNNEQYVYQLFCLGAGEFSAEDLKIEDTNVSSFEEIDYEYYYNEPVTLFPTNVVSSAEPASQELTESFTGPFVANAPNTTANRLEVDVVWESGLFRARSDGDTDQATTSLICEYREIDEDSSGDPVGDWTELFTETITDARRTPLRITRGLEVDPGRYEVRLRRGEAGANGTKLFTRCTWEGLRAYLEDDAATYTGLTVLAVRARATGNLNSNSSRRFNVVATRKLPIWDGDEWSAVTATTSIAWALADIVRAHYGAERADALVDLEKLLTLDSVWDGRGDEFNYRFDTTVTLWDALKIAARAGRAYPIMNNQVISFVRTAAQAAPATIFNRHNLRNFRVEYALLNDETDDSVLAEFVDPSAGWVTNQVLCQPVGSAAARPKRITYRGITDRDQAFREGIYDATCALKQRKVCRFETELEGYIPNRGDMIIVANEDFRYDQGGEIVAVSGTTLTTSEDLTFGVGSYAIRLRKADGTVAGPHVVTAGSQPNQCVLNSPLDWSPETGGSAVRSLYQLGLVGSTLVEWIVQEIKPRGGNVVELVCVAEVDAVHTADEATPPPDNTPAPIASDLDAPVVRTLLVENTANPSILYIAWSQAPGAVEYVLERSLDAGVTWSHWATTTNTHLEMPAPVGALELRVAGVGRAKGPWKYWSGTVGEYVINSPSSLSLTSELALSSSGDYVTNLVFEFTVPVDDIHVKAFEAQYRLARHADWKPLYNALENRWEWQTGEIGQHQVRVRTVYVQGEVYSDWAETSLTNLGTFTSIASVGLAAPVDPKLFVTTNPEKATADLRIVAGYDPDTGAVPDRFVIFYSTADAANAFEIGSDTGTRLYLQSVGIAGLFTLPAANGGTTRRIRYTDTAGTADIDLSGMWWISIESTVNGTTQYYKVAESSSTELLLGQGDELPFVPAAGDTIHVAELDYGDSRLPEFKLVYANSEVIRHSGIKYDTGLGLYYLQCEERGAEGTSQADQSNQTAHYYPALGPLTNAIEVMAADFVEDDDGNFTWSGTTPVLLPSAMVWASVTCCLARKATAGESTQYVRSNIIPLTVAGPA